MVTRSYFIRYSPWNYLNFGSQFRGKQILAVPAKLYYERLDTPPYDFSKQNSYKVITFFPNSNIPSWHIYSPRLRSQYSVNVGNGILPWCSFLTEAPDGYDYDGNGLAIMYNNDMLYSPLVKDIWNSPPNYFGLSDFDITSFNNIGWGPSIETYRDNLIAWCQYNIHVNLDTDDLYQDSWKEINIVIWDDGIYRRNLIYAGNDPLANYTTTADDVDETILFDNLTDW